MLKNKQNIDEIIQNGLEHFNPTPPTDVWNQIEKQIQSATPASPQTGAGNPVLEIFKQMGIAGKIATLAAVPLLGAALYFGLNQNQDTESIANQTNTTESNILQSPPIAPIESNPIAEAGQKIKGETPVQREKQEVKVPTIYMPDLRKDGVSPAMNANTYSDQLLQSKPDKQPSLSNNNQDISKSKSEDNIPLIQHPKTGASESGNNAGMHAEPEFGNVFSPDGDGKNDTWEIQIEPTTFYHLRIFDRNGQLVFDSEQAGNFWNGMNNKTGVDCESGTYTYIFDYQFDKSEKVKSKRGFINLLR